MSSPGETGAAANAQSRHRAPPHRRNRMVSGVQPPALGQSRGFEHCHPKDPQKSITSAGEPPHRSPESSAEPLRPVVLILVAASAFTLPLILPDTAPDEGPENRTLAGCVRSAESGATHPTGPGIGRHHLRSWGPHHRPIAPGPAGSVGIEADGSSGQQVVPHYRRSPPGAPVGHRGTRDRPVGHTSTQSWPEANPPTRAAQLRVRSSAA